MTRVVRTVIIKSTKLPRRLFRILVELESIYRSMVEQLTIYAVRNNIKSFIRLKTSKYREMRSLHSHLPSHYVYTACQDASTRTKSFQRLRRLGLAEKDYPEIRRISIWLDDHLWKPDGYTSLRIATHKGWITVEFEPYKQYWKYINRGWRLASETKIKLDRRNRQLIIYLTFTKDVEEYNPKGYLPVDVNENSVAVLTDGKPLLFETDMKRIVLGYYYRRKRIQEKYDKLYGVNRAKRKVIKRLKERKKKNDVRWKIANIIVRTAYEKHYTIVLEKLDKRVANNMIEKVRDKQLRHRIFQASFRGIQRVIKEKAQEYGVPIIYINPKNTSRLCPVHGSPITYSNNSRIGRCSRNGELWHRDVVACWNLFLKAQRGDGSIAPSSAGLEPLDGSPVPLDSTATHDPIRVERPVWTRWKSLRSPYHRYKKQQF